MSEDVTAEQRDRDDDYWDLFESMQKKYLKSVVCDEIVEEHKARPLGQHSEPLARLLHYFRRLPNTRQFAIKKTGAAGSLSIVRLSAVRGEKPLEVPGLHPQSIEDAYHQIFLLQLEELMRE